MLTFEEGYFDDCKFTFLEVNNGEAGWRILVGVEYTREVAAFPSLRGVSWILEVIFGCLLSRAVIQYIAMIRFPSRIFPFANEQHGWRLSFPRLLKSSQEIQYLQG